MKTSIIFVDYIFGIRQLENSMSWMRFILPDWKNF